MSRTRVLSVFLSVLLSFTLCVPLAYASDSLQAVGGGIPLSTQAVKASPLKNLKQRGVKFDLKNGKTYTSYMLLRGAGKMKYSMKMSGLKVTNVGKTKRRATFTVEWNLKSSLTAKQIKSVHKQRKKQGYNWAAMVSGWHIPVTDYVTGMIKNNVNGSCKVLKNTSTKRYIDSNGSYFQLGKCLKVRTTITFPSSYKNLCVGAGFGSFYYSNKTAVDKAYDKDKQPYYKTSWFKKDTSKNGFHFMRVR